MLQIPELLAPAGDLERLRYAINYGADAVYCSLPEFGMRSAPANFTPEQLTEGVIYAHARGRKVYLTMNTLPTNEEAARLPDAIKEAAKAALDDNDTHYPPGNGYPYLLEEISKFEAQAHGLHYTPDEIIMTVGATEALFASFSTILNAGDEVIIPTPAFGLYEALVQLNQGVPVSLPTENNHFQIDPEALRAAIGKTGYEVQGVSARPYEKKGLFGFLKK